MNVPSRLAAFAALLGLVFGGAALAGAAIDPTDSDDVAADAAHGGEHAPATTALSGLASSEGGLTLKAERTHFAGDGPKRLRFRIVDARGRAVRDEYELESERELHLVVVRRDTAVYEHVHPRRDQEGTWSADLQLREPGVYRAYADFQIDGSKRVLATDLFVPGSFEPNPLPAPRPVAAVDGFSVARSSAPSPQAGRAGALTFSIRRGGQPVSDLEPYLGARGHLVALREGDLGYLHVHPKEGVEGNAVSFEATFPTAGRYRLFFQFKTGGEVRTVAYTLEVRR